MKTLVKLIIYFVVAVIAAGTAFVVYVMVRWDRTFDVEKPALEASEEEKRIKRGDYLVNAASACSACHVTAAEKEKVVAGELATLGGGRMLPTPLGDIHIPNITSHETGIGKRSDGELARLMKFNVRHDGRVAFPLMEFQGLSNADIIAILSYLRTTDPIDNEVAESDYTFFGKLVFAFVLEPVDAGDVGSKAPPRGPTRAYGEYLAKFVSACVTCHTQRTAIGGEYEGVLFAGGFETPHESDPDKVIIAPNLTPHPETGVMAGWTEKQFIKRFRDTKPSAPGSIMPWGPYSRMTDDDLKALYLYLSNLNPVANDTVTPE